MESHPFKYAGRTFKTSFEENDGEAADIQEHSYSGLWYQGDRVFSPGSEGFSPKQLTRTLAESTAQRWRTK